MSESRDPSPTMDLAVLITLATALVYAAGLSYAYRWYASFDIGIIGLDIPAEYFLMYGFWTLKVHWWFALLYISLMIGWLFVGDRIRLWLWRLSPVWVLIGFWSVYLLGGQVAASTFEAHKSADFQCFPLTRVWLKSQDERVQRLSDLADQLSERDYRLMLQTSSILLLIKPKPQGHPVAVMVPMNSVDALRMTPVNPGCRG